MKETRLTISGLSILSLVVDIVLSALAAWPISAGLELSFANCFAVIVGLKIFLESTTVKVEEKK